MHSPITLIYTYIMLQVYTASRLALDVAGSICQVVSGSCWPLSRYLSLLIGLEWAAQGKEVLVKIYTQAGGLSRFPTTTQVL